MVLSVPAPPVRPAGTRLTASVYGSDVTDDINYLANVPMFKGYQSAAQSIGNASLTAIAMDTEVIDSYSGHDNVTNNSRYTCSSSAPGYYSVIVTASLGASAVGDRVIEIHKNGSVIQLGQFNMIAPTAGVSVVWQAKTVVQLAAGDYVEGKIYQTSGGALNTIPTQTGLTVTWEHS